MADKKISALTASTTPLAGTEVLPIVQSGSTVKVAVSNLTAGRSVGMQQANIAAAAGGGFGNPALVADDGTGAARIIFLGAPYAGVPANKPWIHSYQDIYVGSDAGTTFNVISSGVKTLGVDGSGNATVLGNFVPSTAGKGIDFSANANAPGMTSELLNYYAEGNWTPALSFGGGSTGIVYGTQTGRYTKIGNRVYFNLIIILTSQGSSTGGASISGLPFAAAEGVACSTLINNMSTAAGTVPQSFASGSAVDLYYQTTGTNAQFTHGNFTNTAQLYISGCYRV